MPSRLLRAFFTLATFVAAWCVVTPAFAAGPLSSGRVSSAVEASFAPPAPPPPALPPSERAWLCDPRGAITTAPPPQMQDVEVTLDVSLDLGLSDCMTPSSGDSRHAAPGRAPVPIDAWSASADAATTPLVASLPRTSRELIPAPAASTPCSRPGFRSTVDRPPRV